MVGMRLLPVTPSSFSICFEVSPTELHLWPLHLEAAFHYVVEAGHHLLSAGITGIKIPTDSNNSKALGLLHPSTLSWGISGLSSFLSVSVSFLATQSHHCH